MKTIVVDCRMLSSSGIGTYLRANLKRLMIINKHDFILIGREEEINNWLQDNQLEGKIINSDAPIFGIYEQWHLSRIIPKQCDLYWAPHYVIPVFYNGKMIITIHDVCHLAMPQFLPNWAAVIYAKIMFFLAVRKANKIIADSWFTKKELMHQTNARNGKIEVIYPGCPSFPTPSQSTRIPRPYILYVGNVKPHKNLGRVIEAHAKVYPLVKQPLVIVGKKSGFISQDKKLDGMMKNIPEGQVLFTGYIEEPELAGYYQNASMLVLASLYEGFGFPAIEAMSFGVPVLASNVASLPEVCGNAAIYCDPYSVDDIAKKIELLIWDQNLQKQLTKNGMAIIKKYSFDKSAKEHLTVINEVLNL